MPMRLPRLSDLALAIGTTIFMLAILEGALAIADYHMRYFKNRAPHLFQRTSAPGMYYEMIPNLKDERGYGFEPITTNSLGFRSPEIDPNKPTIVLLGDSLTAGMGLTDDQLNSAVIRKAYPDYNVLNAGVFGYNMEQEVSSYREKIKKLKPSLVILAFCFNDFLPSLVPPHTRETPESDTSNESSYYDESVNVARKSHDASWKGWLYDHSHLVQFLERKTKWLPFRNHAEANAFKEEFTDAQLAYYQTWLEKFSKDLGSTDRIFMIWPLNGQMHLQAREKLHTMARANNFKVLDLYDLFSMGRYPTLWWDAHPGAKAHKQAGEYLLQFMKENNLPKQSVR